MQAFNQLFLINLKMIYRNKTGLFWTLAVPLGLYVALAILPIPSLGQAFSYKDFVLPGVIAYLIMQSGVYTLAYWMVDLKSRGVIRRFLATPIKNRDLVLSLVSARLTVIILQVIIITLIGIFFFNATFTGNIISTLILVVLGGALFLTIGLLISNAANSYEAAAPMTAAIGMPLAFLGNLFVPLDILPKAFQTIGNILPITYLVNGLRSAYLRPFSFNDILPNIIVLSIWLIVLLLLAVWSFKFKAD